MRIDCIGGGPAGLYFALLMKKARPNDEVIVYERNRPDDTFGWGVVFSDQTLGYLAAADPESHAQILDAFSHWDDIEVHYRARVIRSGGHGFCGIGRKRLLRILQDRCREVGVDLRFEAEVSDVAALAAENKDGLIVASDGIHSAVRQAFTDTFRPQIESRDCRFIWLGTHKTFDAFTFLFEETEWGWFQAHAYRFDRDTSTFIVETPERVWKDAGLDRMNDAASIAFCEQLFGRFLEGHPLMSNAGHRRGSAWIKFQHVTNERWFSGNVVLMGDAAHSAHFSVGSGTKLALEDAIALARELTSRPSRLEALERYEAERKIECLKIQNAARNSTEWFEHVDRYTALEADQFAYSLLTRSQRLSHENLRLRDAGYVRDVEAFISRQAGVGEAPVPPMFTPFRLRELQVHNRVVVSPMATYSAVDGVPGDFLLVHLGARAHGGAGLLVTEMTSPSSDGRISPGCTGLWNYTQGAAWKRICDYVHQNSPAKIALQLGHAGPKGSTQLGWQVVDEPLAEGNWPLIGPSAIAYGPQNQVPASMTAADLERVKSDFVQATRRAVECGFDALELHCAHGYLLSAFLCPLTNHRDDAYGGDLERRLAFPLEVFRAVREVFPASRPISIRISAHDWAPGGNTADDGVVIARRFAEAGADLIDVSSGQTTRDAKPIYGRMYQTPFADRIRNEVGIATMAVGAIFEPDHVNSIIAAGRADLCAIGRPHLADPNWTLHAAAQLGYTLSPWPVQYLPGKAQLERNLRRAGPVDLPG